MVDRRHRRRRALNLRPERRLRDRSNPLEVYDRVECFAKFRFFPETILFICDLVSQHIERKQHQFKALTVIQSVCIVLRFLACGSFYVCIGDTINVQKSTVCREVSRMVPLLANAANRFIRFPTGRRAVDMTKTAFQAKAGFPDVLGCVDGTLIQLEAPRVREEDYVCRKGFHAINVQVCCDADRRITNIVARWPGSVHDSRIFGQSILCREFEHGTHNGVLLGDGGYGIRTFLMTPYRNPNGQAQNKFNVAHRATRTIIEQTIGILKRKFACIKYILRVQPPKACQIIVACAVLYNIGKDHGEPDFDGGEDDNDLEDQPHDNQNGGGENQQRRLGQAVRDRITEEHFS